MSTEDDPHKEAEKEPAKAPPSARPSLGRAGAYDLLVELASGGMATVFLGRASDGREGAALVAIKRPHKHLAADKTYLSMLLDEARLASAIHHPNVVKVRELGFESGEPFIVMDYVEGASLSELRKELAGKSRAVDPRVAVRVVLDALAGLGAAHVLHDESGRHLGIVHRDVSPHNVLIGSDGSARLTDFGIAKAVDRVQVTRTHEVKGKLAYLAPERIDKRRLCTAQSDVFSMAVVLWECIAGRRLFRGDEAIDTLQEVISAPIPPLRRIGAPIVQALDDVILRGLSRDLDTRYKTAAEFASALEHASGKGGVASTREVAHVVETVFGARMRQRYDEIRSALSGPDAEKVLEVSGLHPRHGPEGEVQAPDAEALAAVAPPAPSARYIFGNVVEEIGPALPRTSRRAIAGLAAVLALGVAVSIGVLLRNPASAAPPAVASVEPTVRRVVVPLPFLATQVMFDDSFRALSPAQDVVAFEVARESGRRHRVTATAIDGSRAQGYVREAEGVAKAEGDGFTFENLDVTVEPQGASRKPAASASAPPAGRMKNGFTKLK